jgi:hypothetical protein
MTMDLCESYLATHHVSFFFIFEMDKDITNIVLESWMPRPHDRVLYRKRWYAGYNLLPTEPALLMQLLRAQHTILPLLPVPSGKHMKKPAEYVAYTLGRGLNKALCMVTISSTAAPTTAKLQRCCSTRWRICHSRVEQQLQELLLT